jgi:hypothetical protein
LYQVAPSVTEPTPDAVAVLGRSSSDTDEDVAVPDAVANLMFTMRRTATAEPTPEPVADLRFLTSLAALDVPDPAPVATRKRLRKKTTEEDPVPAPDACLITNKNGSASLDDVADPVADLNKISRSVLVDSPADPDPVACLTVLTRRTADCVPVPLPVAVRSYIAGPM